jgi:hypothetical protein
VRARAPIVVVKTCPALALMMLGGPLFFLSQDVCKLWGRLYSFVFLRLLMNVRKSLNLA